MRNYENMRNPVLPLDVHTPDSEAHVMPDGNLYLYGSYDDLENMYCSDRYVVVSTSDLKKWSIHEDSFSGAGVPWYNDPEGPVYDNDAGDEPTEFVKKMEHMTDEEDMNFVLSNDISSLPPLLFAPDCIEKDGKYYLYFCMADGSEGAAVSDRPEGPFRDPVRLPCSGIDPAVFVDEDGRGYYYWGQFRSHAVQLGTDMRSFDPTGIRNHVLTEEEHFFHEGSSMRKIGDTYYAVFADMERGKPTALGYATGKSPLGPFTYRGIIIDNDGCDPADWNNHGSIECFHGQWYVFYHRSSRNSKIFRRLCIELITILPDGSIPEVKMTSQGAGKPFGPKEKIMGYQACGLSGKVYIAPPSDLNGRPEEALVRIASGDQAVFRYIVNESRFEHLFVQAEGSGFIEVLLNGQSAGSVEIQNGRQISDRISFEAGEYELELIFTKSEGLEIDWIYFE